MASESSFRVSQADRVLSSPTAMRRFHEMVTEDKAAEAAAIKPE